MTTGLGVDPGTVRTGVAVGVVGVASPLDVLTATGSALVEELKRLASDRGAAEIVVGHPLRLDGTAGPAALAAEDLAECLRVATGLPVTLWDERLTTSEAESALRRAGVDGRRRRRIVDKHAAAVILQSYLDARSVG